MVVVLNPLGTLLVPIDGETQLAARYRAWEGDPAVEQEIPRNRALRSQPGVGAAASTI